MKKKIFIIMLVIISGVLLSSCDLFGAKTTMYRVSFYTDGKLILEEEFAEESLIDFTPGIVKRGYIFKGWYKSLNDEFPWDFDNYRITSHMQLHAKWELEISYIDITNLTLDGDTLRWDEIEGATYKIHMLEEVFSSEENSFSLKNYKQGLKDVQTVKVEPVKEGFTGIIEERVVKFNETETISAYDVDFDMFDYSEFKELNRSSYKDSIIDHDDHFLEFKEARLTTVAEFPKTGIVALILRENGSMELKEGYHNFAGLEFNLGSYKNAISTSKVDVYITNNTSNWTLAKSYSIPDYSGEGDGFNLCELSSEEVSDLVNLNEVVYIKLVADVSGSKKTNIVIDDVVVYEYFLEHFTLSVNVEDTEITLSDYYKSAQGLKGKALVDELRIIVSTNLVGIKYRDFKEIGEFADYDEDDKSKVIGIYDRRLLKANWGSRSEWHREHVWPNSRLGMDRVKETEVNQGSDPHNLRAIYPSTNSSRSNRYYDLPGDLSNPLGHTITGGMYYPGDLDKGDVSRILMYMVIRYDFLGLTDSADILGRKAYTAEAAFMGKLSLLLDWHNEDPVDAFEKRRNDVIYSYQNNRNPFIDHPELFEEVFNYFLSIDQNRALNFIKYFEFLVDLNNLKEEKGIVIN